MTLDFRVISRLTSLLLVVLSIAILGVGAFSIIDRSASGATALADCHALFATAGIGLVIGAVLFVLGRRAPRLFGQREALLLVAIGWLFGAALGALPYYFWSHGAGNAGSHPFDSFVNCYFETMSGLTTTGATILTEIGTVPRSLLLWRAMTHWFGGLGIVVLFVAVLPMLGVGSRRMYRIEAPGPTPEGVHPRIQDTARVLWLIYCGLTLAETIALRICGMTWFDALCHTMATLATGGFSTLDSSVAGFDSSAIHLVIILFMILAGVNFGLYYQLIQRRWSVVWRDPELRVYLSIMAVATAIIAINLLHAPPAGATESPQTSIAVRDALFQVVSIQTTTGFGTADFDTWSFASKFILVILMFIGASGGSTGGGIKVSRIIITFKVVLAELEHVYRPKVVRSVRIGKSSVDPELRLNTLVFVIGIVTLFGFGTIALMLLESHQGIDITTAATASAATLNNIGPGLGRVGATQNYLWFTDASKIVMSMLMVLGRLEMFTIIVLFTPRFWRGD